MRSPRRLWAVPGLVMFISFSIPGWLGRFWQAFLFVGLMPWLVPFVAPRRIAARPASEATRQPAA